MYGSKIAVNYAAISEVAAVKVEQDAINSADGSVACPRSVEPVETLADWRRPLERLGKTSLIRDTAIFHGEFLRPNGGNCEILKAGHLWRRHVINLHQFYLIASDGRAREHFRAPSQRAPNGERDWT